MTTIRFKRGSEEDVDAITPVDAEPVWDQENKKLRVGDGSTAGGIVLARDDHLHDIYVLVDGTRAFTGVVEGITPTASAHLATKGYVDNFIQGLDWQDSVLDRYDPTGGLPAEVLGNRYISTATASGWTENYIYEFNGVSWTEIIPNKGFATWVEDEDVLYAFNGTTWVKFGNIVTHNNLAGLQGGTSGEYYHLTAAQEAALTSTFLVDSTESDQGAINGTAMTVKYIVDTLIASTTKHAVLYFTHDPANGDTTTYTWDTSDNFSSYPFLSFKFDNGAEIDRTTGDETLTLYSPENISAGERQRITADDMLRFGNAGIINATWFGMSPDETQANNTTALENAFETTYRCNGVIDIPGGRYSMNPVELTAGDYSVGIQGNMSSAKSRVASPIWKVGTELYFPTISGSEIAIKIYSSSSIYLTLRDFSILGPSSHSQTQDTTSTGLFISDCPRSHIDNINVSYFYYGFDIEESWITTLTNCTARYNYFGLHLGHNSNDINVTTPCFEANHVGIAIGHANDVTIFSPQLEGCTTGLYINPETGYTRNITIRDPYFESNTTDIDIGRETYWSVWGGSYDHDDIQNIILEGGKYSNSTEAFFYHTDDLRINVSRYFVGDWTFDGSTKWSIQDGRTLDKWTTETVNPPLCDFNAALDNSANYNPMTVYLKDLDTVPDGKVYQWTRYDNQSNPIRIYPASGSGQTINGQSYVELKNQYDMISLVKGRHTSGYRWNIVSKNFAVEESFVADDIDVTTSIAYRSPDVLMSNPFQGDLASLDYVNTRDTTNVLSGVLSYVGVDDQGNNAFGVWGDGKFIYLANGDGGLVSYSVSTSGVLTAISTNTDGGDARDVWGDGRFLYVANEADGLDTYSVSSTGVITHIDGVDQGGAYRQVWGDGRFIYAASSSGLGILSYSVDESGNLTHIDTDATPTNAYGVWGDSTFLYVADSTDGLLTYSVDDYGALTNIDTDNTGGGANAVWGDGKFVYTSNGSNGVHVYSVDTSGNLTHLDSDDQSGNNCQNVWGDGHFLYVAYGAVGLHTYSVSSTGILTHIDSDDQGGYARDVWGDGNFVYLANDSYGLQVYSVDYAYVYNKATQAHSFVGSTSLDGAVVINESGADIDFRIEGTGQPNALFVDGTNGRVGVGTNAPGAVQLKVAGDIDLVNASNPRIFISPNGTTQGWTIQTRTDASNALRFNNLDTTITPMAITTGGLVSLLNGTGINEFSTDGTLAGDSDDAVPTEQAVKTYVDGAIAGSIDTGTDNYLARYSGTSAIQAATSIIVDDSDNITGMNTLVIGASSALDEGQVSIVDATQPQLELSDSQGASREKTALWYNAAGGYGSVAAYDHATSGYKEFRIYGNPVAVYEGDLTVGDPSDFILLDADARIEICNSAGTALIDFKTGSAEDYDARIIQSSNGLAFYTGGNGATALGMTIDSNQVVTFEDGIYLSKSDNLNFISSDSTSGYVSICGGTGISTGGAIAMTGSTKPGDPNVVTLLTSNTARVQVTASGHLIPYADNSYSCGQSGYRWTAVWAVNGTIQTSDRKEKENINTSDLGLEFIKGLNPVSFDWKTNKNGTHHGLIAQEVDELLNKFEKKREDFAGLNYNEETDTFGLQYSEFIAPLIKAIQELSDENESLKRRVKALEQ